MRSISSAFLPLYETPSVLHSSFNSLTVHSSNGTSSSSSMAFGSFSSTKASLGLFSSATGTGSSSTSLTFLFWSNTALCRSLSSFLVVFLCGAGIFPLKGLVGSKHKKRFLIYPVLLLRVPDLRQERGFCLYFWRKPQPTSSKQLRAYH